MVSWRQRLLVGAAAVGLASCSVAPESRQPTSSTDAGDPGFAQSCPIDEEHGGALADVDGDGRMDRVSHYWDDENGAALVVCTAEGSVSRIQGMGQAESMELLDVDGDGAAEILFGATSAQGHGAKIARWHNGELVAIHTSDGEPLLLHSGGGGDYDDELGWAEYSAFGCEAARRDGGTDLIQGVAKRTGRGYRTTLTTYTIRETRATPAVEQTGEAKNVDEWLSEFALGVCVADRQRG